MIYDSNNLQIKTTHSSRSAVMQSLRTSCGLSLLGLVLSLMISHSAQAADVSDSWYNDIKIHLNEPESFGSNLSLRQHRKIGLGLGLSGLNADYGVNGDLNFEDENGAFVGFGKGRGFQSVHILWKHAFEGSYLSPYFTLGYARWFNSAKGSSVQNSILDQVLNADEKRTGVFGADFAVLGGGMQYYELSGELKGFSFYGEANLMLEARKQKFIVSGSIGTLYYF